MPRFFVKNNQINNDKITIIDEDVKHIKNVLRKQIGDKIFAIKIQEIHINVKLK